MSQVSNQSSVQLAAVFTPAGSAAVQRDFCRHQRRRSAEAWRWWDTILKLLNVQTDGNVLFVMSRLVGGWMKWIISLVVVILLSKNVTLITPRDYTGIEITLTALLCLASHWPHHLGFQSLVSYGHDPCTCKQEAQLSPNDRAMCPVNWNLANCHATVQKLLIQQFLTKSMVRSWRFSRRQCVVDNVHSTMVVQPSKW